MTTPVPLSGFVTTMLLSRFNCCIALWSGFGGFGNVHRKNYDNPTEETHWECNGQTHQQDNETNEQGSWCWQAHTKHLIAQTLILPKACSLPRFKVLSSAARICHRYTSEFRKILLEIGAYTLADDKKELTAATLRSIALNYIECKSPKPPKSLQRAIQQLKRLNNTATVNTRFWLVGSWSIYPKLYR